MNAKLVNAKLWNANLEGANLEGANLEGANLSWANLERTNFLGAKLPYYLHFQGAKIEKAILSDDIKININKDLEIWEILEEKRKRKNFRKSFINPLDAFEGDIDLYNEHYL